LGRSQNWSIHADTPIRLYHRHSQLEGWLERYQGQQPIFACVLGFTATGLWPGISAAGATPAARQFTAIADAEFLYYGPRHNPRYALPPLQAGASPVFITRGAIAPLAIPLCLFNAGLPYAPMPPAIDLGGMPARCLSQGNAMDLALVEHLFQAGLHWGQQLATHTSTGYVILAECVVGGTTTALSVLSGLGWQVLGKVNSSHPTCNHEQKQRLVDQGLQSWKQRSPELSPVPDPMQVVAALGDPMQVVVAGMAIAASRYGGVLLGGGTQMLAVYALLRAIAQSRSLEWIPDQIVIGTTRWVAEDTSGDTVGLAQLLDAPLMATQLNFAASRYPQLQAYEQGFVKEGVGAGAAAIAAHLYQDWSYADLLTHIEALLDQQRAIEGHDHEP
jgi:uncharacterized protein (TIGR00303 family)